MISGWGPGLGVGLALGLRHALDADHLVAVTSILSRGRSGRAAIAVGFWWGVGHATTLVAVGALVLATGWHFPEAWQKSLEAAVGGVILVLGLGVLRRHWRRRVHWHLHEHADKAHSHFHRHPAGRGAPNAAHETGAHDHGHRGPGIVAAAGVGTLHGLAGSGPLVVLLALTFTEPSQRYAALLASAVGSVVGMMLVTGLLAVPFAWSRASPELWYERVQVAAGVVSVTYGFGLALSAVTGS